MARLRGDLLVAVLSYVSAMKLLTLCAPVCAQWRRLVDERLSPVVRTAAHMLPAHTLGDGSRVHLTGGVCSQTLVVRGRQRITGRGELHSVHLMHRDDRLWACGVTMRRFMVSRGAATLRHCRLSSATHHCVVSHRAALRMWQCDIEHMHPGSHYTGVYARRSALDMRGCRVRRCFTGVSLEDCSQAYISRLRVEDCQEGVLAQRCSRSALLLEDCDLRRVSMGVQLVDCGPQTLLRRCAVSALASGTALQVTGPGAPRAQDCVLEGAVALLDGTGCLFYRNTVTGDLRVCRCNPVVLDSHLRGAVAVRGGGGGLVAHNRVGGEVHADEGGGGCELYDNQAEPGTCQRQSEKLTSDL